MTKTVVSLEDKYTQGQGTVMLSALQGVVRLLLDQARRDRAAGIALGAVAIWSAISNVIAHTEMCQESNTALADASVVESLIEGRRNL